LCCARALGKGELGQEERLEHGGLTVRPAIVPCSSKVEVSYLFRILEEGADGVEVVACPDGKCQFLAGNVRAQRRVEYARRLLDAAGLGAERIGISRAKSLSREDLIAVAEKRAREAASLGPNPMKEGRNG
jgi:coenzyme F420-reducing hydrogenase delta subunit